MGIRENTSRYPVWGESEEKRMNLGVLESGDDVMWCCDDVMRCCDDVMWCCDDII